MRVDLRVKHDIVARKAAIGLFERGHGSESAAKALSVPRDTVRQWLYVYRSFGSEVLLSMDGKQTRYTYEQKVAAASAVVDGGMSKRDAMEAFGVMSLDWQHLFGRFREGQPRLPELDRRHVAQRRVDPEVVVPVHVVRELGP